MKRLSKNKVLAFVIAIMMIAALFPTGIFSVSATIAQGNAIEDAEDFAKMDPDGTYYLAKSITLTETYAKEFTGNFNGNGHTITVSAPIFDQVMNAMNSDKKSAKELISQLCDLHLSIPDEKIQEYVTRWETLKNFKNSPTDFNNRDAGMLVKSLF